MKSMLCAQAWALLLSGCATIVGGARDKEVTISSDPPGAQVLVDDQPMGATPTSIRLSRRSDHQITVSKPGYEPVAMMVHSRLNPWIIGNVVFGGLVGVVVDVCTGATFTLDPDEIKLTLRPMELIPASAVMTPAPARPAAGSDGQR